MLFSVVEPVIQGRLAEAREESIQLLGVWLLEEDCNVLLTSAKKLEHALLRLWDAIPKELHTKTNLGRHLYFLLYRLNRREKDACTSDVIDIALRDLPELEALLRARTFKAWSFDADLRKSVEDLLRTGHGAEAIHSAFVALSERLRRMKRGISHQVDGHKLVEDLFGGAETSGNKGRMAPYMADAPRRGMRNLLLGLYTQFRNPSAHRPVKGGAEAAGLVLVIDRVLKDLAKLKKSKRLGTQRSQAPTVAVSKPRSALRRP